ncbi:MAG: UDP-N-acetylmuramoyl-L-alanine--D-glutamate ligase [Syntrophobacterales bacterium]|nr:UDP-N-acetylmuramoyl-L-alanine--D-glutamate ligase [Syntrophobacterales bacterium]
METTAGKKMFKIKEKEMDLPDDILIAGLGKTGIALTRFLAGMGKRVAVTDAKREEDLNESLAALNGVKFKGIFGGHDRDLFLSFPMIVISPGIDSEEPFLREARGKGIPVIGELELAARFVDEPIITITGTNGKTTTTTLIGEIFEKVYPGVFVGGNIGNPFINYVREGKKAPYIILEVSSFQLETINTFHPGTAVLLNITEDHLDRYRSYDEYIRAKYRIFENSTESDYAIIGKGLPVKDLVKARTYFFSAKEPLEEGAFLEGDTMHVRIKGEEFLYKRALSRLVGIHNTENILAALIVAHAHNIEQDAVEEVVSGFTGLAHRVEPVRTLKGITFYNDSKATNVDAAKRAIESMDSNVILIAGGKDKGGSYQTVAGLMGKIKAMILIGEAKEKIAEELSGFTVTYMEEDLTGAVERALAVADRGDSVLFSPMCSSFDMFRDYKERGNIFKRIVESL